MRLKLKVVARIILALFLISTLTVAFKVAPITMNTGADEPPSDYQMIPKVDEVGSPSSMDFPNSHSYDPKMHGLDFKAQSNSKPGSFDSAKWNFDEPDKWPDFTIVDSDSAELVIGVNNGKPSSYASIMGLIDENGGELVDTVSMGGEIRAVVADIPLGAVSSFVADIRAGSLSRYIEPNMRFQFCLVPNDPNWTDQWGPAKIEADYAWNTTVGDPSVVVAVIDTGVDWDHPDLAANIWNNTDEVLDGADTDGNGFVDDIRGWDFVDTTDPVWSGEDGIVRDNDPMDFHGHGTHCSGIVAAVTNNSMGIAGVCWNCKIMAVRAGYKGMDGEGYLDADDAAAAISYAADNGADVISMSWSSESSSAQIYDAVEYAYDSGVLLVAAAGNDESNDEVYPAAYDEVIAVTATDENDDSASFTNFGDWVELAAPGVGIYSTVWDDSYTYMDGTSMSTPHVAGVAALSLSQFPNMTRDQVRLRLRYTADDLGDPGFDDYYGYGRINAHQPEHDLVVTLETPPYIEPNEFGWLNTTVYNCGLNNETDVELQLLINGTIVSSTTISELLTGKSYTINFQWTPTVVAQYNVTGYAPPVSGESIIVNNVMSKIVYVYYVVALISDSSELLAITGILDSMGIGYDIYNDNSIYRYTEDLNLLLSYHTVIFYNYDRLINSSEHSALQSYLSSGGNLLVTGYDSLGHPDDPLLADVVRSSSPGDNWGEPDLYVVYERHPIMDGPYGSFPAGYHISGLYSDCDAAEADIARNAITVAELEDGYDKIMATELSSGRVVYWNGEGTDDWTTNADCEAMFKNTINWLTVYGTVDLKITDLYLEPSEPMPSDNVTFKAKVENQGTENATNFIVELYLDEKLFTWYNFSLAAGANTTYSNIYPWNATLGNHTVRWVIDATNVIVESNEDNNEMTKKFIVGYVLTVQTPYSHITVKIDGSSNLTGSDGNFQTYVDSGSHEVEVQTPVSLGPSSQEFFVQWSDGNSSNPRTIFVNNNLTLTAEYVADTIGPSIGTPFHDPHSPNPDEQVTVSVNVTDDVSGVREVILSYSTDGGQTWHNVTMTKTTGNTYQGEIPELPDGTNVQYEIIAYDNADNEAVEDKGEEYYVYLVVPEFPTWTVILATLCIVSIALMFFKRKIQTHPNN